LQLIDRIKRDVRGHAALIVEKRLTDVEEGARTVRAGAAACQHSAQGSAPSPRLALASSSKSCSWT
jgi:hypothetical protein